MWKREAVCKRGNNGSSQGADADTSDKRDVKRMECEVITQGRTCLSLEEANTIGETPCAEGYNYRGGRDLVMEGVTKRNVLVSQLNRFFVNKSVRNCQNKHSTLGVL